MRADHHFFVIPTAGPQGEVDGAQGRAVGEHEGHVLDLRRVDADEVGKLLKAVAFAEHAGHVLDARGVES